MEILKSTVGVCLLLFFGGVAPCFGQSVSGLKVPLGFDVTQVADDGLATNVYCMAVSPRGDVFVSGPGFIKRLIDADQDGIFESATTFAAGPKSGAQGMCFDGDDLLCTGDGGVLRFRDSNGDRVADGPPEIIIPIRTGGEHHAHAIRKGPDGWWYILAGNQTPILKEYYSGPNSPVIRPRAGFLMRVSPDWATREIYCHGFRNAYDFDFNAEGHVFVFDSDGERDISLPWYRPTRLFRMRPGDDAGWISPGWKRPSQYFDMPIEIGAWGRGSPTGVVVGDSRQFPADYDNSIFVGDWTFGRVIVVRRTGQASGSSRLAYDRGTEFISANGQFGFAVTDLDFASDGSLLVSVGGRGTRGAIYRVTYRGAENDPARAGNPDAPFVERQPIDRPSVNEIVERLGSTVRSIQVQALEELSGRRGVLTSLAENDMDQLRRLLNNVRAILSDCEPKTAALVMRVLRGHMEPVGNIEPAKGNKPVDVWKPNLVGHVGTMDVLGLLELENETSPIREKAFHHLIDRLATSAPKRTGQSLGIRIAQMMLGGCIDSGIDPMFSGYAALDPIAMSAESRMRVADQLAVCMKAAMDRNRKSGSGYAVNVEVGRLAAMLKCSSKKLRMAMIETLTTKESTATEDIHWLICIARSTPADRLESGLGAKIAKALIGVGEKIDRDGLNIDRNYYPRMRSLARKIFQLDNGRLANQVARAMTGSDSQVYLYDALPESARRVAFERFYDAVEGDTSKATVGQVRILATKPQEKTLDLIRQFAERPGFQEVVVEAVSRQPRPLDRSTFLAGLSSTDLNTIKNSAVSLRRIFDEERSTEVIHGIRTAGRLGWDGPSMDVRDQLVLMLRLQSGEEFGYRPGGITSEQAQSMKRWQAWSKREHPAEYSRILDANQFSNQKVADRMKTIHWETGDFERGKAVYRSHQCAQCHEGGSRLGPRLEGVMKRFGRMDLFRAITVPNDQVAGRYRAVLIETANGRFYKGSIVYESADGITLQEVNGNTMRINNDDIEMRTHSNKSLMPEGLLGEATDQEWADLYEFLRHR